jgi:hypothetical protein
MGFVLRNPKEVETLHSYNDERGLDGIFLQHDFSEKNAAGIHEI